MSLLPVRSCIMKPELELHRIRRDDEHLSGPRQIGTQRDDPFTDTWIFQPLIHPFVGSDQTHPSPPAEVSWTSSRPTPRDRRRPTHSDPHTGLSSDVDLHAGAFENHPCTGRPATAPWYPRVTIPTGTGSSPSGAALSSL